MSQLVKSMLSLALAGTLLVPALAQETVIVTDDLNRIVEIPANPQRIAALHDFSLTIPLIELGIVPVASRSRIATDGSAYLRGSLLLTGLDIDTTDIRPLGNNPIDVEALVAAQPDLIIADDKINNVDQLAQIAPTIVIDDATRGDYGVYQWLAEFTGTEDRLATLQRRYEAQVAQVKRMVDGSQFTVNVLQGNSGELLVQGTYGSLGQVLRDAGFVFPALIDTIPAEETQRFSAEALPDLDADVLFVTYRDDIGETSEDARSGLESVVPGFCNLSRACRNGQMIFIPRDEALAASYAALGANAYMVLGALNGREIVVE